MIIWSEDRGSPYYHYTSISKSRTQSSSTFRCIKSQFYFRSCESSFSSFFIDVLILRKLRVILRMKDWLKKGDVGKITGQIWSEKGCKLDGEDWKNDRKNFISNEPTSNGRRRKRECGRKKKLVKGNSDYKGREKRNEKQWRTKKSIEKKETGWNKGGR